LLFKSRELLLVRSFGRCAGQSRATVPPEKFANHEFH
jgi:hypothetical protein